MRLSTTFSLLALAATVFAAPFPQEDDNEPLVSVPVTIPVPTVTVPQSTSLNIPITSRPLLPSGLIPIPGNHTSWHSRHSRHSHTEPIPIFSSQCDCPDLATIPYPCWATDSLQRCNFEELHSLVCWTSAARGCPTPTRSCADLYKPTPVTGKHPCEMSPGNPTEGPEPVITSPPNGTSTMPLKRWSS